MGLFSLLHHSYVVYFFSKGVIPLVLPSKAESAKIVVNRSICKLV